MLYTIYKIVLKTTKPPVKEALLLTNKTQMEGATQVRPHVRPPNKKN